MLEINLPDDNSPVPLLGEWAAIFAQADTSLEPEFYDWECTLTDGLDETT